MKLQKFNALTIFVFLINILPTYGMEHNHNDLHPLLRLPLAEQQRIIFPGYTHDTMITVDKMDDLKEVVKAFFVFNSVCKQFNKNFKLPWSDWKIKKKNKMLQDVNALLTNLAYEEYRALDYHTLWYQTGSTLSYKKYSIIPLALVYSGASPDVTSEKISTLLSKALFAQDETAVALLLNHGADPYQQAFFDINVSLNTGQNDGRYHEDYFICFYAPTVAIAKLFLEKVDKQKLLSSPQSESLIFELIHENYSLELMKLWIDYGINLRNTIECRQANILHVCAGICSEGTSGDIDSCLKKVELLLAIIPDMVNKKDSIGYTCIDVLEDGYFGSKSDKVIEDEEKMIELFKQYGGKTTQELEKF